MHLAEHYDQINDIHNAMTEGVISEIKALESLDIESYFGRREYHRKQVEAIKKAAKKS